MPLSSPSSNRTGGFPASGSHGIFLSVHSWVGTQLARSLAFASGQKFWFRSSRSPCKSVSCSSGLSVIPSGPLGSADITPLLRYYGPIRLPANTRGMVMSSHPALGFSPGLRSLSVPDLVCRHAPSPSTPGNRTIAHTRCFIVRAGLALFDGLAAPTGVTRLFWVRLTLRLAPSPSGASWAGSLRHHARLATWLTGHSKVNSFQFTRQNRFP